MEAIDRLIETDRKIPKRIDVIGDVMQDVWLFGYTEVCQEDCLKFVEERRKVVPGGAGNAARQLENWNSECSLWGESECSLREESIAPTNKIRMVANGKIIFRHDIEKRPLNDKKFPADYLSSIYEDPDAILISDYDKGFLSEKGIEHIIRIFSQENVPVVVDAKRNSKVYSGAIIKANEVWFAREKDFYYWSRNAVMTRGHRSPRLFYNVQPGRPEVVSPEPVPERSSVSCINHVGAGDCFAAHLVLALAHGLSLEDASEIAHAAGRVYVQHPLNRPPWPHEIRKDLDPIGGKILSSSSLHALRESISGRIVFTNGVFRIPHAGHTWFLEWAKSQGDILVVGINDDLSARLLDRGFCLSLGERTRLLAGQQSVDWVVPFSEAEPLEAISQLKPDVLAKGHEYENTNVPGSDRVQQVVFAPPSPYADHSSDLVTTIRENRG